MTGFFVRIYDYLRARRPLALLLLIMLTGAMVWLASRLEYEEDISKFLPSDPQSAMYSEVYEAMSRKGNIILLFRPEEGATEDDVAAAMDEFETLWAGEDGDGLISERQIRAPEDVTLDMIDFVSENYPYFLEAEDYARIDSLLAAPGWVDAQIEADKDQMLFPSGAMATTLMRRDPLHLFTPLLEGIRESSAAGGYQVHDGFLFARDGTGIGFMTSPYGSAESGMNGRVASLVEEVALSVMEACPGVRVTAVGPPLIAAGNAERIKRDSILAIVIALVLISILLSLSFRRVSDILRVVASTAFGWLFAVAVVALVRQEISVIVLGLGSVIIGIAVNYPLHFVDGLKSGISPRENLREMVEPLLIGNITTVAAFACLLWMDAAAMRDLGLFGALMLVGTILFSLVFLPLGCQSRPAGTSFEIGWLLPDNPPRGRLLFLAVLAGTVVMVFLSRGTTFDSNMQNINYMSAQQREDLAYMTSSGVADELFAAGIGESLDEAIDAHDKLARRIAAEGLSSKGSGRLLPSREHQSERLALWEAFRERHPGLLDTLGTRGAAAGFAPGAFAPFEELMHRQFGPEGAEFFEPVTALFEGTYIFEAGGGRICVMDRVSAPERREEIKQALRGEGAVVFGSEDVSNRLASVLSASFDYIGFVCGLVVLIFLVLSFRRLELAVTAFLPLAAGWYWILGTMGLFGLKFNIVNIILATFIFGQGDDYTIFITEGLIHEYAYGRKRLATWKNSVVHSAAIMFIGIGALIVARHPALRSLALVVMVGMAYVVLFAYYLPPLVFGFLTSKRGKLRDVPLTLGRLCRSLFALVFFAGMMYLWVYPLTFIHFALWGNGEESKLAYHRKLQRIGRWLLRHVPGVSLDPGAIPEGTFDSPAVVLCNHQSHLDILCLMMLSPKLIFFTNDWVWRNPLYGYVIRKAEYYPVADGLVQNFDRIKSLVERGYSIAVFPEGTRSADCTIGRFHKGAFYLAENLSLDIVPVMIHGAGHVLPKEDFMLRRGRITVRVGRRTAPSGDYRAMTKAWHARYIADYEVLRKEIETPSYFIPYVRSKYAYKGSSVESLCRRTLAAAPGSALWNLAPGEKIAIRNCGQGEMALLFALVHPGTEVWACDPDADNMDLCRNLSALPENLHFTDIIPSGVPETDLGAI